MPSSLTDTNISDTYRQVLHISDGLSSSVQKRVRDGDGTESAIKVSTSNAQEAVKGMSVDGTSSADVFDLNTYDATKKQFGDEFIKALVDLLYPVGSLYLQGDVIDLDENNGVNGNDVYFSAPGKRFPGTVWTQVSKGRFLVGTGNTDNELIPGNYEKDTSKPNPYTGENHTFVWTGTDNFSNNEKANMKDPSDSNLRVFPGPDVWWKNQPNTNLYNQGAPISSAGNFRVGYYEHQLQVTEMPRHTHPCRDSNATGTNQNVFAYGDSGGAEEGSPNLPDETGGDQPHNNIPPYYGVNIWKRVK